MSDRIDIRLNLQRGQFNLAADLQLPGHGVSALFGPSGSGKTTLLRAVAGLERVPGAVIRINGEVWQDGGNFKPVHERALGYVFQEASLFSHLSVHGNLEYGQKRIPATQRRIKLDHAVELLGIGHLLERRPDTLSGGERQRVAIARALLTSPKLLLMDEPLAALDRARKAEILPYLERLHGELDMPVLYVSHSPEEVARLADHLVLLDAGKVVASGPLSATLARLDLPGFFQESAGVVIDTTIVAHDETDHLSLLAFVGGEIWVNRRNFPVGQAMRCRIDSRDVSITLQREIGTSILNILPATITGLADTDHPARVLVQLDMGGTPLLARITRRSAINLALASGKQVWAQIKAVALLDS